MNVSVNAESLKKVIFPVYSGMDKDFPEAISKAENKVMKMAYKDGFLDIEKCKELWSTIAIIGKSCLAYRDYKYDFEHFNPLGNYNYIFLANTDNCFIVLPVENDEEDIFGEEKGGK